MRYMFLRARKFNQDISGWNLSSRLRRIPLECSSADAYNAAKAAAEAKAKAEAEAKAKAEAEAKAKAEAEAKAKAEAEAAAAADADAMAIMQPGNIIALHNTELRRFVRMNGHNGRMDSSTPVSFDNLPANWEWAKCVVGDAGRGQIALHNTETDRFCRLSGSDMDSGKPTDGDPLNPKWRL